MDESGDGVIRYIELEATGDSPAFSDLKKHLKRHGSPIDELFTVVAYRQDDKEALTSPLTDELTFLYLDKQFSSEDVEVTFDIKYFTVDRQDTEPAYFDFLERLTVESGESQPSLETEINDIFSIREITKSFYEDFGEIFRETLQDTIHGLEDPDENLNPYTRTVVNRVLFLLFVEEKGWLDGDTNYVENKYQAAKADPKLHVYDDFFEPLFFDALSNQDKTKFEFLGEIPFFNGGLFEQRDIELDVTIEEEFFDSLLDPEEGESGEPKGFLRRYKISLQESNPSEQELVVDPEFIGRIFEMFMQEDERSEVGAFYTPKPITAYMTKNALKQHLLSQTKISHDEAVSLVSDHSTPDSFTESQAKTVDEALHSVTVLDPAVGSGAFIIAMLEELVEISEALDAQRGEDRSRFQLKEEFIADSLYGVDIDAGGIELTKFRVWLHLMQDLAVDHEEFLESNVEFALPNLGFKFFVGNSLVGEHDPINIDAQQATLAGGLDETLEEIHEVRTAYQTAHGEEKSRLTERLEELTAELETQLAVEEGNWMTEVAAEAEETFAWTTNIPEVILEGGFDIVIGNPPYEGQSKQDYIGELARFYDEKYDFYKTIPGMRHDLYQKFIIRGWELTREKGVMSYITSDTFYTIGSKQTTRQLLQQNEIKELLQANPDTFDAAVNPAIFVFKKTTPASNYRLRYIDATETDIDKYRSIVNSLIDPGQLESERYERAGYVIEKYNLSSSAHGYDVPLAIYRETLRSAFFEPTDENLGLFDTIISKSRDIAEKWQTEIRDSDTLEENLSVIKNEHLDSLEPGDVSILGLLTIGGQGLATGNNDEYLAYLEGTRPAEKVINRNNNFDYTQKNENQFKWMSRVIQERHVTDTSNLSDQEKRNGRQETDECWVPIIKGKGNSYYTPVTEYIDWSYESVQTLQEVSSARWQGFEYFFKEGLFISRGGTGDPVVRYAPPAVIDSSGGIYIPTTEKVSARYLNGLLNSNYIQHIIREFINGTVNTQIQDMRVVPIVIPTEEQQSEVESLVDEAIAARIRESGVNDYAVDISSNEASNRGIEEISKEIDDVVESIYHKRND